LLVADLRYEVLRRKALPMLTIEFICALFCSLVERACARVVDLWSCGRLFPSHAIWLSCRTPCSRT
jgi:hypothetical protein